MCYIQRQRKISEGISTVCRVLLEEGIVTVCDSVKGHGWRIVNEKEAYFVAGSGESKAMQWKKKSYSEKTLLLLY